MKKFKGITMMAIVLAMGVLAACKGSPGSDNATQAAVQKPAEEKETGETGRTSGANGVQRRKIIVDYSRLNLNPMAQKSADSATYEIYEMLFALEDGIGSPMVPVLADGERGAYGGYDHEAGSGVYTFYIQDNIYDHAGNHLTASDVVFSFEKTLEYGNTSGWSIIEGWEAVDDTTVRMNCSRELTQKGEMENIVLRCFMFTEAGYQASPTQFASDECGTGPYYLTEFVDGSSITLKKYDDFWQKDEDKLQRIQWANVDEIVQMKITENSQRVIALTTGTTDVCTQLPSEYASQFIEGGMYSSEYTAYPAAVNGVYYLEANVSEGKIGSDINFRKAVMYAVSGEAIVNGLENPANMVDAALGCSTFSDYNPQWSSWDNYNTNANMDTAKEYLEKSSYGGENVTILGLSSNNDHCVLIQSILNQIGVNCELRLVDTTMLTTTLADPASWDLVFNISKSSDYNSSIWSHLMNKDSFSNGGTEGFYVNDEYQQLLQNAMVVDATMADQDAFWQYTVDQGLAKGLYSSAYLFTYKNNMMDGLFFNDKVQLMPGACTYLN